MAQLDKYSYPWKTAKDFNNDWDALWKYEQTEFEKLREASDNLPEGEIIGTILSWPRGDGGAYYIVTKASPLTLTWIPMGDAWQADEATIRGTNKKYILEQQRRSKMLSNLFGKSKFKMKGDE